MTVEVKFDMKAKQTGNLCFEFTNSTKPTGVCVSKADEIWYVLETKRSDVYKIYRFNRASLLSYLLYNTLLNPSKQRVLFGGDRKSFGLIIIPVATIELDINQIGEVSEWQIEKS